MNKPILYIMIGLPGAGKSQFIKRVFGENLDVAIYSRDEIRFSMIKDGEDYFSHEEEVYKTFVHCLAFSLAKGWDTVADATHLNHYSRAKLTRALYKEGISFDKYEIVFIYLNTPIDECIKRDKERVGRAHVGAEIINQMDNSFVPPSKDEFPNVKGIWIIKE